MPLARRDPLFTSLGQAQGARDRAQLGRRDLGPAVKNTALSIPTRLSAHRPRPAGMLNRFGAAPNARAPWRPAGVMRKCGTNYAHDTRGIM